MWKTFFVKNSKPNCDHTNDDENSKTDTGC